jgi:hypothetical protein
VVECGGRSFTLRECLEWKGELKSRVERCGEVRGWCSPFIGAGGVP